MLPRHTDKLDVRYGQLNLEAFEVNARGIAYVIGAYAADAKEITRDTGTALLQTKKQ